MLIYPDASNGQNNIAAVSAEGSTVWVFMRLKLLVQPLGCVGGAQAAPRQARKGEQTISGFLPDRQQLHDASTALYDELLTARGDLFRCRRIDHVVSVGGDFLMQTFWRVGQKTSVLVDRAALHRYAVPDRGNGLRALARRRR